MRCHPNMKALTMKCLRINCIATKKRIPIIMYCHALVAAAIDIMLHYSQEIKFGFIIKNRALNNPSTRMCAMSMVSLGDLLGTDCWRLGNSADKVLFKWHPNTGSRKTENAVSKAIGVACAVGGGLSAGKEGPMIHSGAVVGAGISQGKCQTLHFDTGLFKEFRNDRERRDFVSAGAAAGVAAAFGAPIGGVLFSLEEGASFWNQNLTWRMFFSAMISAFTVNSILSWFNGRSGWLSWTGLANFGVFENKNYNIWEIPLFLAVGVIGGLTGALFNHLNARLTEFRKKYMSNKWQRLIECLLVAAISAFTAFITLFLVDDCQPVGVNPNITEVNQMWCKKGEYSAVAKLFFQNPEESVKSLFHSPINSFRPWTLLIFSIEYFLLTMWTFALPVPAGVFIPAILTGAAWGRLFGIGVGRAFPTITGIDPGKYALVGAAAQLGGIVRMTISLTAIIMEATKDITFGLPIMLVLMITKWVGDTFNEGLYDMHIDIQEIPILGWHPPKMSRNILAEKVMRSDVVAMERRERVSRVIAVLRATNHHGFPVVDRIEESPLSSLPDYGHLKGVILRSQLITLLEKRVFYSEMMARKVQQDKSVDSLRLSASDEQCWMDLEPFIHPHPHRVPLNASLPFIFQLFRGLGLRYLTVVNDDNKLRGIITRKDVARFRERRSNRKYQVRELYIAEDRTNEFTMSLLSFSVLVELCRIQSYCAYSVIFVWLQIFTDHFHPFTLAALIFNNLAFFFNRMLIPLLSVIVAGCVAEWVVDLEYSLNSLNDVHPLGKIELRRSFDGNYTATFRAASGNRLSEGMAADPASTYLVLARSSTHPKDQLMSSSKTCLLLQSNLFHYFWLSVDAERQLVQSLTVFPDIVAAGDKPLDSNLDCSQLVISTSVQPSAVVHVNTKGVLPTPDTQLFVQMMERERRARQHGAEADDRSFLGKYWMYIVPVVVFVVISNAMTPDGGGEG
ncbi:chloride transporter, ClC family [Ostertagia ostertagi]